MKPMPMPGEWADNAACSTRAAVFQASDESALTVCARCPVLSPCRAWAMGPVDPVPGLVAGGITSQNRAKMRAGQPVAKWAGTRRGLAPIVLSVLDLLAERLWLGSPDGWALQPGHDPDGQWWGTGHDGSPQPATSTPHADLTPVIAAMLDLIDERPWLADGDRSRLAPTPGWSPAGEWLGTGHPDEEIDEADAA